MAVEFSEHTMTWIMYLVVGALGLVMFTLYRDNIVDGGIALIRYITYVMAFIFGAPRVPFEI